MLERANYEFKTQDRVYSRDRAFGRCEFPAFRCDKVNSGRVNHITGIGIARRVGLDPAVISNPKLNSILLCFEHQTDLDRQEKYQMECLIYGTKNI